MTNGRCDVCGGEWFAPLGRFAISGTLRAPDYPDRALCGSCGALYEQDANGAWVRGIQTPLERTEGAPR